MSCSVNKQGQARSRAIRSSRWMVSRVSGARHAGSRLVEQKDLWIAGERDAEFDLLLVAVRQRSETASALSSRPSEPSSASVSRDRGRPTAPEVAATPAVGDKGGLHVLEHAELGEDVGALKRASHAHQADAMRAAR